MVGLNLEGNSIADISPLVTNTGLGSGDFVDVKGNPLSSVSINTHIPVLQEKGVDVMFDHRTPQKIRIVSGDNQQDCPALRSQIRLSWKYVTSTISPFRRSRSSSR